MYVAPLDRLLCCKVLMPCMGSSGLLLTAGKEICIWKGKHAPQIGYESADGETPAWERTWCMRSVHRLRIEMPFKILKINSVAQQRRPQQSFLLMVIYLLPLVTYVRGHTVQHSRYRLHFNPILLFLSWIV